MDREEELHRQQHRKYCEQQILKVGLQKGALYSIISGISVLLSQRYCNKFLFHYFSYFFLIFKREIFSNKSGY